MRTQDTPLANMIDRVAAARALASRDDGCWAARNHEARAHALEADRAPRDQPTTPREALIDAAQSWSGYLDELSHCAREGKVTGSELPEVPLRVVLAGLKDAV
jgi:hypothetical protein